MIVLASEEGMDEEGARKGCGRLFSLLPDFSIPLHILLQGMYR
jgi:hypothetical protein